MCLASYMCAWRIPVLVYIICLCVVVSCHLRCLIPSQGVLFGRHLFNTCHFPCRLFVNQVLGILPNVMLQCLKCMLGVRRLDSRYLLVRFLRDLVFCQFPNMFYLFKSNLSCLAGISYPKSIVEETLSKKTCLFPRWFWSSIFLSKCNIRVRHSLCFSSSSISP